MRDHTQLRAFQLADEVAMMIYAITQAFPSSEAYGLTSQMRRAAVSVPSNIVEGCARSSKPEYARFLEIAFASLRELSYQLSLAIRLKFCTDEHSNLSNKLQETERVLGALLRSQRRA